MPSPFPAAEPQTQTVGATAKGHRPGGVEDRYRSLFLIGRGGMGTVEVALERGAEGFERIVALKRLLPEGARDPRHKEMFLREARLAALLAHPNVVHAFAFGELYGELFMAMEYVEGEPLSHVLRAAREIDRGLPAGLVAFVLAQVCEGLHAAHELREGPHGKPLRVVHRDVSPHNVMIAYDGRVKLLDFGVAKFEAGGHETRTGEVKGKMAYMSPEQALGEKLDRRSDLFSVGAVLFECLTGSRMWGSGTDLEVMRRLALESPPRLEDAAPNVAPALADLHARLMARDPAKRPATAQHVAEELRALASTSRPPGDEQGVRELMPRLFGHAEGRRTLLIESLQDAAPSRAERLRGSLGQPAMVESRTSAEPVIVRSPAGIEVSTTKARSRLTAGALLFALAGAVVAASAAMRKSVDGATASTPARAQQPIATAARTAPAVAVPDPVIPEDDARRQAGSPTNATAATQTVAAITAATPPPVGTTGTRAASPGIPLPTIPSSLLAAAKPAARPAAAAKVPAPEPSKLPDVDPTPF